MWKEGFLSLIVENEQLCKKMKTLPLSVQKYIFINRFNNLESKLKCKMVEKAARLGRLLNLEYWIHLIFKNIKLNK